MYLEQWMVEAVMTLTNALGTMEDVLKNVTTCWEVTTAPAGTDTNWQRMDCSVSMVTIPV